MKADQIFQIGIFLVASRLFGARKPLFVSWQLTNHCNAKCAYCDYWKYPQAKELDTADIFKIVNELASWGTLAISFTGGEPLIRQDIGEILEYVKSKGIVSKINTNGFLVGRKIKDLACADQINLSFDGPEHIHDQIRGSGSYKALFEAVSMLYKNNKKMAFHTVISKYNANALNFILDKCREVNLGTYFQPATELYMLKKDTNIHSIAKDDFARAIKILIRSKKEKNKYVLNSLAGLRHLSYWPSPRRIFCTAGRIMFRINPAGEIYNCERFPASNVFNCLNGGIKEAMRSKGFPGCSQCWCGPLVELNLLMQGKISAIINSLSYI